MLSPRATALSLLVAGSVALFSAGCSKQPQAGSSDKASEVELAAGLRRASVDSVWQAMIASNDRKIATTRYFLGLFSYTNIADTALVHQVRLANDSLPALRYDQSNLRDRVDGYDAAENRVLQGVGNLYNGSPELQKLQNAAQAVEEIKAADDSVLIFRYLYDKAAEEYNTYLNANKKALPSDQKWEPLPMFRLNS